MATPDDKILVEPTSPKAFVLFELLASWDGENDTVPLSPLTFEDDAERWAPNDFFCPLEETVAEPFLESYDELPRAAKGQIPKGREWHR